MNSKTASILSGKLAGIVRTAPTLQSFLSEAAALDPALATALDGMWCGREGTVRELLPSGDRMIVVQWYNGKVETSYIS